MPRRILLLRRENIGDLILTTPLIHALRKQLPGAYLAALVNSYNAPVLSGNTDLDDVFVYKKGKHASNFVEEIGARLTQARLLLRLRQMRFDDVVLGEPTYTPRNIRTANFILGDAMLGSAFGGRRGGTRIIGFEDVDGECAGLDVVASKANIDDLQMAQILMRLAAVYDINTQPDAAPICRVLPPPERGRADARSDQRPLIGLHISARKPSQRWPVEHFAALADGLAARHSVRFRVLWSPGDEHNLLHPGDDKKAEALGRALQTTSPGRVPIDAELVATHRLEELIAAVSELDLMICADGGAMHIGVGLGKPIVALFGDSDTVRWRPWKVPNRVLQAPTREVADITVAQAIAAVTEIVDECGFADRLGQFSGGK